MGHIVLVRIPSAAASAKLRFRAFSSKPWIDFYQTCIGSLLGNVVWILVTLILFARSHPSFLPSFGQNPASNLGGDVV